MSNVAERSRKVKTETYLLELDGRTSLARDGFHEVVKSEARLSQLIRELWISQENPNSCLLPTTHLRSLSEVWRSSYCPKNYVWSLM